jgi:hypothetical protein
VEIATGVVKMFDDYPNKTERQLYALKMAYQEHGDLYREQMIEAVEGALEAGDELPNGLVVARAVISPTECGEKP